MGGNIRESSGVFSNGARRSELLPVPHIYNEFVKGVCGRKYGKVFRGVNHGVRVCEILPVPQTYDEFMIGSSWEEI